MIKQQHVVRVGSYASHSRDGVQMLLDSVGVDAVGTVQRLQVCLRLADIQLGWVARKQVAELLPREVPAWARGHVRVTSE